MDYKSILELVRKQNPDMPYKEAQKKASEMHKKFVDAQEELAEINNIKDTPSKPVKVLGDAKKGVITNAMLIFAEKQIREMGANKNSILSVGREVLPDGKLVIHGKDGANTLVSFEDEEGNTIPLSGYFKIFL